jgi:DNA-directed RNA polymerase subunit RPC12/RpoP
MSFWKKLLALIAEPEPLEPAERSGWVEFITGQQAEPQADTSGTTLVCANCRKFHRLAVDSFMMSPRQALAAVERNSGGFVFQIDGTSRVYLVGELRTFPERAQANLIVDTKVAIAEAADGLRKGQALRWCCRNCDFDGNTFAPFPQDSNEQRKEWPYPSDGFFREASRKLVADHGPVVRVTDCGIATAVRWRFTYNDGHEVVVGNPGWPIQSMAVDVDFFPGMVGSEGRTFAKVFFTAAGLNISGIDIFGMPNGSAYDVRNGRLVSCEVHSIAVEDLRSEIIKTVTGDGDRDRLRALIRLCDPGPNGLAILTDALRSCKPWWHALADDLRQAIRCRRVEPLDTTCRMCNMVAGSRGRRGAFVMSDHGLIAERGIYDCMSCGAPFCANCIVELKGKPCPICKKRLRW